MSFNIHDLNRNACMLKGPLRSEGYDWWWHSFTGVNVRTGEERSFSWSSSSATRNLAAGRRHSVSFRSAAITA